MDDNHFDQLLEASSLGPGRHAGPNAPEVPQGAAQDLHEAARALAAGPPPAA